jgi:deoxyribodipyrimidine photo-lyase
MQPRSSIPASRLRPLNGGDVRTDGEYVLYWMTSARRTRFNFALDRALELAGSLSRPLVVLEALRCDYPYASDRHHRFVLEGMRVHEAEFGAAGVTYYPYVEPERGAGKGLLRALAESACAVVADDSPAFFFPRMLAAAAREVSVAMEAVDSYGLLPFRATDHAFSRAYDFRRFLQRELAPHLRFFPAAAPLAGREPGPALELSEALTRRWPRAGAELLAAEPHALRSLPIDHDVFPVELVGGAQAARARLAEFVSMHLEGYAEQRNEPDRETTSGLSPYLHFGHTSAHEVFAAIARAEGWSPASIGDERRGARSGWWGLGEGAEAFLDQLVTWRELGVNFAAHRGDIDRYDSLPGWAQETLAEHAHDSRPHLYTHEQFEAAQTHDELWNAAQTQLRESGRIHNYLRMLWGKKILHWSPTPQEALASMLSLNDRYALDGRDPNSYSGVFWVLGRYDRAWGPEREVFGKVRYMSSKNTHRKLKLERYLATWRRPSERGLLFPS